MVIKAKSLSAWVKSRATRNASITIVIGAPSAIMILAFGLFSWPTEAATQPEPISAVEGLKPGTDRPEASSAGNEALAAAAKAAIPLKVGLTSSSVWKINERDYEHECLSRIAAIDARGMLVKESCPIGPARDLTVNDKVAEIPTIETASIKQNEIVRIRVLDHARIAIHVLEVAPRMLLGTKPPPATAAVTPSAEFK